MFLTKNNKTMSSSAICPKFSQNAWRKDLCSNCFKSKEDHKISSSKNIKTETSKIMSKINTIPTPLPSSTSVISSATTTITTTTATTSTIATTMQNNNSIKQPLKSIMKYGIPNKEIKNKLTSSSHLSTTSSLSSASTTNKKTNKVCFPKEFVEIIGYGGDWSDCDNTDDEDNDNFSNTNSNHPNEEITHLDEEDLELERLTKSNTDFNMNNGNLLGNATDNIKKSFAALRLGAPQLDAEGKKQTLKISVQPFGAPVKMSSMKEKFELSKMEYERISKEKKMTLSTVATTTASSSSSVTLVTNKLESNNKKDHKEFNNSKKITTNATSISSNTQQSSIINNVKDSLETAIVAQVDSDGTNSPPVERAMEKSLLEEISETLEQKKLQQEQSIQP